MNYTQAHEYASGKLSDLVSTTFQVRPKSGREATSTFEQGQGDVLLSYENEAILLDRTSDGIDYLNPPETFRIENPVAVVNTSKSPQQAEAFRDYLFSKDADKIWAQEGFRTATDLFSIGGGANMYLATVIDCYSRRLIGFAIADQMRTSLVQDALTAAKGQRGSLKGAIFHSDHGRVYTSQAFQQTCTLLGVKQSMGAIGTSADNALAESFNTSMKREVLQDSKTFTNQLV